LRRPQIILLKPPLVKVINVEEASSNNQESWTEWNANQNWTANWDDWSQQGPQNNTGAEADQNNYCDADGTNVVQNPLVQAGLAFTSYVGKASAVKTGLTNYAGEQEGKVQQEGNAAGGKSPATTLFPSLKTNLKNDYYSSDFIDPAQPRKPKSRLSSMEADPEGKYERQELEYSHYEDDTRDPKRRKVDNADGGDDMTNTLYEKERSIRCEGGDYGHMPGKVY